MYKVVRRFKESKHDGHIYEVGDEYPAKGKKSNKTRLEELFTTKNKYGYIYIEKASDEKDPPTGQEGNDNKEQDQKEEDQKRDKE